MILTVLFLLFKYKSNNWFDLKSLGKPFDGILNCVLQHGHLIWFALLIILCKQSEQNVWLHGNNFGSLYISRQTAHVNNDSNSFSKYNSINNVQIYLTFK